MVEKSDASASCKDKALTFKIAKRQAEVPKAKLTPIMWA